MFLTPARSHNIGQIGEAAFQANCDTVRKSSAMAISKKNPWLCATADFVAVVRGLVRAVEVKTRTSAEEAARFAHRVPSEVLLQVWLQLEVLQLNDGLLVVYHLDQVSKRVNRVVEIDFHRSTSLFSRDLWVLSALRYSRFLKEYLRHQ